MCGILGIACYDKTPLTYNVAAGIRKLLRELLVISEMRGTDASGLCTIVEDEASVFKLNVPAQNLITKGDYSKVIGRISTRRRFRTAIGHTRAKTKGTQSDNHNNHPIISEEIIGVHNGMVNNDDALFSKYKDTIRRAGYVDSEIIFRLIEYHMSKNKSIETSVKEANEEMCGGYACAFVHRKWPTYLTLFTNSSSIPIFIFDQFKLMVFASTYSIVQRAIRQSGEFERQLGKEDGVVMVGHGKGLRINLDNGKLYEFEIGKSSYYNQFSGAYHL